MRKPDRVPRCAWRCVLYEAFFSSQFSVLTSQLELSCNPVWVLGTGLRFWSLGSVFRAPLLAIGYPDRVEGSPDYVVADAREIFHAAPPDQHDRVLLQVVADAGDVSRHFDPVG